MSTPQEDRPIQLPQSPASSGEGSEARKLRVCVVAACPVPFPRGTPARAGRFTEAVARLGHEVHLVTYGFSSGQIHPSVQVHRGPELPWLDLTAPGPSIGKLAILDPVLTLQLRKLLRRERFDIVHAHHFEGLIAALATRDKRIPLVYDAHTVLESELPSYGRWLSLSPVRSMGRWIDRSLPRRADFVLATSERLKNHLKEFCSVPDERIEVIGNGVEPEFLQGARPSKSGPPSDGGALVYAGNLAPYQGIDRLLEAFRSVLAVRPSAVLRILTDSSFDAYEAAAGRLGVRDRIDIRSIPLESLPAELAAADLAVNPRPHCDGVPQKNLNYMAASLPIVAYSKSLQPAEDGRTGVGVDGESSEALAEGILSLLDRPEECARLGSEARRAVERAYTWPSQARRIERIYRQLVEGSRP